MTRLVSSGSLGQRFGVLGTRNIDVWAVQLTARDIVAESCFAILSPDERVRADSYRFDGYRRSFVLSRGILRALLGCYLSVPADTIRFSYTKSGKPCLFDSNSDIRFNLSHSADTALYAMTRQCDVGIDIERIRPLQDMYRIEERFFCPQEIEDLRALPLAEHEIAFFNCWSRKEAYVKAIGEGLLMPFNRFRVTLRPGDPVQFVHLSGDREAAKKWTLQNISIVPGYAAAIAYHDEFRPLRFAPFMTATEALAFLQARTESP
jgi:4'-phosphopantetheinyl transferase